MKFHSTKFIFSVAVFLGTIFVGNISYSSSSNSLPSTITCGKESSRPITIEIDQQRDTIHIKRHDIEPMNIDLNLTGITQKSVTSNFVDYEILIEFEPTSLKHTESYGGSSEYLANYFVIHRYKAAPDTENAWKNVEDEKVLNYLRSTLPDPGSWSLWLGRKYLPGEKNGNFMYSSLCSID